MREVQRKDFPSPQLPSWTTLLSACEWEAYILMPQDEGCPNKWPGATPANGPRSLSGQGCRDTYLYLYLYLYLGEMDLKS